MPKMSRKAKPLKGFSRALAIAAMIAANIVGGRTENTLPSSRPVLTQVDTQYDPDLTKLFDEVKEYSEEIPYEELVEMARNLIEGMDQLTEFDRKKLEAEISRMVTEYHRLVAEDRPRNMPERKKYQKDEDKEKKHENSA